MNKKIVLVRWVDSTSADDLHQWTNVGDISSAISFINSVGYLWEEYDEAITIIPHISTKAVEPNQVRGGINIPRNCILEIKELAP